MKNINLNKSFEKLALLNLLQEALLNSDSVESTALKIAILNGTDSINTIKKLAAEKPAEMNKILSEPLVQKIISF